jgi:signal transduction histidine kinase
VRYGNDFVELSLARSAAVASVTVADDGPGVREGERTSVFESGDRGTAAESHGGGAGLGLALARRLARSAGGEIAAVPSADGGRFVVTLPLAG